MIDSDKFNLYAAIFDYIIDSLEEERRMSKIVNFCIFAKMNLFRAMGAFPLKLTL